MDSEKYNCHLNQDREGRKLENLTSLAFRVLSSDDQLLSCGSPCAAIGHDRTSDDLPLVQLPGQRKKSISQLSLMHIF